ncbi:type II toxin-antitoxin system RelE/ParE family toxin [Candidatus Nitrotoga arctica]|uniref:Plasmid stabilization system protein ParE n=1 Tax=Candidatus Nitrotoga arctica TaxID=453162 RepID=A0ABM8YZH0_9PROT|nr:type II toxin-antitoxin system RelE/ParE family toxin [Candidatus Nitrotoga arctica]CAG9932967.1 protein of unknown function [Candidatus Nitrotoga arctica]
MAKTAQLEFAKWARKDLLEIARYIARDNPQRARGFMNELRLQCTLLVEQPGLGVARPDLAEDLRQLPYERYLISFSFLKLILSSWSSGCCTVRAIFPSSLNSQFS